RRTIGSTVRAIALGAITFTSFTAALAAGAASLHAQVAPGRGVPAAGVRELSLDEALALAQARNEAVQVAAAGVTRASGQLRQARSQLFPQLAGTASYQRTLQSQFAEIAKSAGGNDGGGDGGGDDPAENPLARIFASENTVVLGLRLDQTLYSGGRVGAQRRAATMGRDVAEIGVTSAVAQARLEVTQAYYDALLAARLVSIAESSLVQTERAFRQTRLARQVGTTAEFDLLRAQVTRDNQLPVVIQARTQREAAMLRLQQLLELPEEEPLRLTTGLEEGVPETVQATLAALGTDAEFTGRVDAPVDVELLLARRSPAPALLAGALAGSDTVTRGRAPVRQAELGVRVQEELLRAQRAQRLPALGLTSTYQRFAYPVGGVPGMNEFFPDWTVGLGVQLPILNGGRIGGQVQEAEAGLVEARARLRQAEELARLDAQLIVRQLEEAATAYAASAGTAEQAARAYTIAEVRYREGISTQVELDDARLLQQQALANRARAARDLNVARARLTLLRDLPLGASQGGAGGGASSGGASGGTGAGATPAPGGAPVRSASRTTSSAGVAGGFNQSGSPEE
ncbi:MAG TPA: TolC family protein, partial [Gemmatimonadaceae bacterium]|nr:TolC family protein [Gemmatimonadaceae bacterium]